LGREGRVQTVGERGVREGGGLGTFSKHAFCMREVVDN